MCPIFDISCVCGWTADDVFTHRDLPACPTCGGPTNKLWKTGSFPGVIDDTIHETIENLTPTPITFTSRSEKGRWLKEHGFRPMVRHKGTPGEGSDKSAHTSRWF